MEKRQQTGFRINPEILARAKEQAETMNISLNRFVEKALESYMKVDVETKDFDSFEELEKYFVANLKTWKEKGLSTKVIGKKILIFKR